MVILENLENVDSFSKYPLIPPSFPSNISIAQCPITFFEAEIPVLTQMNTLPKLNIGQEELNFPQLLSKIASPELNVTQPCAQSNLSIRQPVLKVAPSQLKLNKAPPALKTVLNVDQLHLRSAQSQLNVVQSKVNTTLPKQSACNTVTGIDSPRKCDICGFRSQRICMAVY